MDRPDPNPDPQHCLEGTVPNFCTYADVFKFIFGCLFVEKNQSQLTELCLEIHHRLFIIISEASAFPQ
jgi:hypothetical protein